MGSAFPKKIGEILLESGLINQDQLNSTIGEVKSTRKRLGEVLVEREIVTEEDITRTLSTQLGIPHTDFMTAVVEPEAVELIPEALAQRHLCVPLFIDKGEINVAMANPLNFEALKDIEFSTGKKVRPSIASASGIKKMIDRYYHMVGPAQELLDTLKLGHVELIQDYDEGISVDEAYKKGGAPPIIRMVNSLIFNAVSNQASDIHIEPHEKSVMVRERVDGLLRDVVTLPKWVQGSVTSRIKIMAKLDITERRIPQDGRIKIVVEKREVDLRISTLPIHYGESVVIRILDKQTTILDINDIGLSDKDLPHFNDAIERPQGVVLVTGPTGSGKTTTLYAVMNKIKSDSINVISLEDPIEYELAGVNQIAINERVGLSFANGLRSILRQDPDVILVGEMRDTETANIAVQASLTGHLVLTTLHTNTAIAAITRLRNMDVEPYLIATSLNGIIAQRLIRKLCSKCKVEHHPSSEELLRVGIQDVAYLGARIFRAVGCNNCNNTGYKGRMGIFEVLVCNAKVRELIASDASEIAIRKAARENGMVYLSEDAIERLKNGTTSIEEIGRVVHFGEEEQIHICRNCSRQIKMEFTNCPYCGQSVAEKCNNCKKPRDAGWKFCPYCNTKFDEDIDKLGPACAVPAV